MAEPEHPSAELDMEAWQEWWRSTFPRPGPFIDERGWSGPPRAPWPDKDESE